ncbi:MAG TPA: hypothetical protein VNU95_12530 [Candidatus Acidoferrales bacterium]|jgi:hypothetical protein|nr:hypothetical protein [Candidatus Acidoferrales bacterium]
MKIHRFSFCFLCAAFIWVAGCASPNPDPLAGWQYLLHVGHSHFDKAVVDDYWDYIHKLPHDESKVVDEYHINEYENEAGQHAVKIETPVDGVYWEHVLIYDRNNKRIKTIKYAGGHYRS